MQNQNTEVKEKREYYNSLNGIRALAAIGIVLMHVEANGKYDIHGVVYEKVIFQFGYFAFLFMVVSAFSMCCGYYDRILNNKISIVDFYNKRYKRIWPFFALLVVLDLIVSPGKEALMEGFADLTLCFSLLPNPKISVIGVGWTLGIIFVFYLLFPFFCYLISDRKKAIFSFIAALALHFMCVYYFCDATHVKDNFNIDTNIIYCAVYFFAGGIIYLYRKEILKIFSYNKYISLLTVMAVTVIIFVVCKNSSIKCLVIFALWMCYAISVEGKILNNKITKYISDISMEIYLCHMLMLRMVEKIHLGRLIGNGIPAYVITSVIVVVMASVFAVIAKYVINKVMAGWRNKR